MEGSLGFRIVDVIELNMPTQEQAREFTLEQRMQVIRARNLPKSPPLENGNNDKGTGTGTGEKVPSGET